MTEESMGIDGLVCRLIELTSEVGSQKGLANIIGISAQHMNDIIKGRRMPGPKVLDFFGLKKEITYSLEPWEEILLDDGFGNRWDAFCDVCGTKSVYIVRPGDARCSICESR